MAGHSPETMESFSFEDLSRRRYESLKGFRVFYGFFAAIGTRSSSGSQSVTGAEGTT